MNDKSCFQFQDHKDEERTKQQVIHHREIASPDVASMILEESRPGLTRRVLSLGKISLDCSLAYSNSQLQQHSPDPFCSPQTIFVSHLLDLNDSFWWDARFLLNRFWLLFPIEPEQLPMPTQDRLRLHDMNGLFPILGEPWKQNQPNPVMMVQVRMLNLSIKHDQLLTKQGILCNQFSSASLHIWEGSENYWYCGRFCPSSQIIVYPCREEMPECEKVRSLILPEVRDFSFRLDDISLGVNDQHYFSANFSTDCLNSHHNGKIPQSQSLDRWLHLVEAVPVLQRAGRLRNL